MILSLSFLPPILPRFITPNLASVFSLSLSFFFSITHCAPFVLPIHSRVWDYTGAGAIFGRGHILKENGLSRPQRPSAVSCASVRGGAREPSPLCAGMLTDKGAVIASHPEVTVLLQSYPTSGS